MLNNYCRYITILCWSHLFRGHKVSMEPIWNSPFQCHSEHWLFRHGESIPHDELRWVGGPIIHKCHNVAVIFLSGSNSRLEEDFSSDVSGTEGNNFVYNAFFFEIVFEEANELHVVLAFLRGWDRWHIVWAVDISCFIALVANVVRWELDTVVVD